MMKFTLSSLFFSVLLLFTSVAFAQGTISGTVNDAAGKPLSFATVEVTDAGTGAQADENGKYSISDVPAGAHKVRASMVAYGSQTLDVTVTDGQSVTLDFAVASDIMQMGEVVITGVVNAKSKLESSVSISTLDSRTITNVGAVTTTEIFRAIPGIRSEASGGEGNTNITARGVPISAGGSKYLQLQEDGLPVLMFGDIAFATSDIFLRADQTVGRIEAIRGGSASTVASNSPAGIINMISKTGAVEGGSVGMTVGLGYNNLRTDFAYGSPIGNGWSFHVGGFFRQGNGPRTAGYTANQGGQVKANLTKQFKNGYARIYYKYLNDRAIAYMPMPIEVSGTNANPTWASMDNFSAQYGVPHSTNLMQNLTLGPDGQLRRSNLQDGMHPESNAIGSEFSFDLGDGWKIEDHARMSFNKGRFLAPFPATIAKGGALANSVYKFQNPFTEKHPVLPGNPTSADSLAYNAALATFLTDSTGWEKAASMTTVKNTDGTTYDANKQAMMVHMFDTELNNMNNMMNDMKVSKTFGKVNVTAGFFKAYQNISMSWLWNSYLTDINGNGAKMLNVADSSGNIISQNGLFAYGVPAWGNCCTRNYDVAYDISAPHAAVSLDLDQLSVDASWRWDMGHVTGRFAGTSQTTYDMNNDGTISAPEQSVSAVNNAATTPVNYKYNYMSYSLGANYKLNEKQAVFGRYSHGGSAKADRILFSGLNYEDGKKINAIDLINQGEIGYKLQAKNAGLFATAFYASTNEQGGFEATTQKLIKNNYRAFGLELEGSYSVGGFSVRGGATITSAKITDAIDTSVIGNTPRRQAGLIYQLMPTYNIKGFTVGLTIFGTTKSFAQDANKLVMPGYAVVNGFVRYNLTKGLSLGINGNNLLNSIGITESEEGSITENTKNYLRARSIIGRSFTASLKYDF